CEDFITAIEEGAGLDLGQFRLWYSQAGTPKISVELEHSGSEATLRLAQSIPDTQGQAGKQPMTVPLRLASYDPHTRRHDGERLVTLTRAQEELRVLGFAVKPCLSINRGFTAPVTIERDVAPDELVFLAAHDDDPFARYEAMQELAAGHLVEAAQGGLDGAARNAGRAALGTALGAILVDPALDDLMRGELMILPGHTF